MVTMRMPITDGFGCRWATVVTLAGAGFVAMAAHGQTVVPVHSLHETWSADGTAVHSCLECNPTSNVAGLAQEDEQPLVPAAFRVDDRWTFTSTNGSTGSRGNPINLTWSIVPDGTSISGGNGEPTSNSSLVSFFDTRFGVVGGGSDLTTRSWFSVFNEPFERWEELSGITYTYLANDDGAAITNFSNSAAGLPGVRGDVRIGAHFIDGESGSNTLAYNYSPNHGDMVLDTGNTSFFSPNTSNNNRGARNVIAHEAGHGLGFSHLDSSNSGQLMEPFISTAFDGPQIDDILAIQRNYGDALEKNGGNDNFNLATQLGSLTPVSAPTSGLAIGTDATDNTAVVGINQTDFVSIDGTSDRDAYAFSLTGLGEVTVNLDPRGPTYNEGPQGGAQSALNTKALADLALDLLDAAGNVLATANLTGAGFAESIVSTLAAGDYFAIVRTQAGSADNVQLYRLDVIAEIVSSMILGDYNNNGIVDAADYTVWQDSFGLTVAVGSGADGNANGIIDAADYTVWQDNFGLTANLSPAEIAARYALIPEPTTALLLFMGLTALAPRRRHA